MNADVLRVYVASPLGFAKSTGLWYRSVFLPALADTGAIILDPWTDPWEEEIARIRVLGSLDEQVSAWRTLNHRVATRNAQMIHQAHGVVAVLDGVEVDSGTAVEVGYAAGLGRWILGYRGDTRTSGDNPGCRVNLQLEYFIRSRGEIYSRIEDLTEALKAKAVAVNMDRHA